MIKLLVALQIMLFMSWGRANNAGAKQKLKNVRAGNGNAVEPKKKICAECGGLGQTKVHGKWFCRSCMSDMGL